MATEVPTVSLDESLRKVTLYLPEWLLEQLRYEACFTRRSQGSIVTEMAKERYSKSRFFSPLTAATDPITAADEVPA
jgi:hypothetical protein